MKHLVKTAILGLTLVLATSAVHAQAKTIGLGRTFVALSSGFVSALHTLGLTPGVVRPSDLEDGKVTFPVTGGLLDLQTARGEISHSGGLTLTAGSTEVRLQSFTIDTTGSSPVLTGLVVVDDKLVGRLPLFNLQLPAGLSFPLKPSAEGVLRLKGVGVTLTSTGAAALDGVFKTNALAGGFEIGTANVYVVFQDRRSDYDEN
jgi:Htaa